MEEEDKVKDEKSLQLPKIKGGSYASRESAFRERKRIIIDLKSAGFTYAQIARKLGLARTTIQRTCQSYEFCAPTPRALMGFFIRMNGDLKKAESHLIGLENCPVVQQGIELMRKTQEWMEKFKPNAQGKSKSDQIESLIKQGSSLRELVEAGFKRATVGSVVRKHKLNSLFREANKKTDMRYKKEKKVKSEFEQLEIFKKWINK